MQCICSVLSLLLVVVLVSGESDWESLLELKNGFWKSPLREVLVSWDHKSLASDGCPLNWSGITCSDGRVTSIILNDAGLVGDFHFSSISGLKMLQNLSISNNRFTGNISGIEKIVSLEFLDLSCNLFNGTIPLGFTNLKNLLLVNLSSNNFEGNVPSGFRNCEKLKYLDFRANAMSADVMTLLLELGSVVHIDLSSNQFNGTLDLGIGNLTFISKIQYFNVSHNLLTGELFAHDGMPYFDNLEVFDASNNKLAGTIPSFNFIVSLRVLRLGSNLLSGSLPEALLQESSMVLAELDISLNQLEGPIASVTSVTMKKLNLSSNMLSGSLPAKAGHCAVIDLSNNRLSGNFSRINSWGNYVEIIRLSSNALTGTFPNQTSQFLRLTSLDISNNSLEGCLPPVLSTYPELKMIDLSLNKLDGMLLSSLFTSTRLTDLNFSGNNFIGPIPLGAMMNSTPAVPSENMSLVSLDLSHNSLSGHLPPELSKFHSLIYLNLSNNNFDGSVPDNLPAGLVRFDVSSNNLSGVLPDNLRRLPDSAFHPGNPLLFFPYSLSSPKVPKMTPGKHKPHLRVALICGLIGGAIIVTFVLIVICYRSYWQEHRRKLVKQNVVDRGMEQGGTSSRLALEPGINMDRSLTSSNLLQDRGSSSISLPGYEHGGNLSGLRAKYYGGSGIEGTDRGVSSPVSIFSSCNYSPSENQHQLENLGCLFSSSPDKLLGDLHMFESSFMFSVKDLSHAPSEVIGRSCHGISYKVELDCGRVLAVKRLMTGIAKGRKEFAREAKKLGSIRHPNLVSLRGYYWGPSDHDKLCISDYIVAPCLSLYLQEREPREFPPLPRDKRLEVAQKIAGCLNYLHNEKAIPHGNLKSSNILIESSNSNALITDYSLHRIMTQTGTAEQVLDAGAQGYRPPEFANSSRPCPSLKSDVYAFGVVLLELLTGKCSWEMASKNPGAVDLTDWVRWLAREDRSSECFDRLILSSNVENLPAGVYEMLQVALKCTLPASERPDMKTVYEDLSSIRL